MKLKVEYAPTAELIPYARNARTHSDEQVAQIAASITEFGFVNPVLVDEDNVIIAGHGRLLAASRLGMETVPVIRLGHLSETQRRALVIADNRLAEAAGWDEEMLAIELQALMEEDFNLDITGFDAAEVDKLLAGLEEEAAGETEDDAVPEVEEKTVSKPGDLWVLGEHRLLCGDATRLDHVERVLNGSLADMCFTDPPYNVNYGETAKSLSRTCSGNKMRGNKRRILNDDLGAEFGRFLYDACVNILTVTKGAVYICMSSSELHTLQKAFTEAGGHWSTFIIWAKNTFTLGRADYQRQYEPILYGWKEGADHYWCGARDQGDVWFMNKPAKNDLHPTMKPVELVERAVRNSSKGRDIVLDPFGGSGSTLIACEKTGRSARLIELDPKYVDVIIRRWQEFTGGTAVLDGDGRTFDEVAV